MTMRYTPNTMSTRPALRTAVLAAALLAIAACSQPPPAPQRATKAEVPARDLVAEVRAAGAAAADALDVQPLRDPVVEDLRRSATRAETEGKHAEADGFVKQALTLSPNDPELLQWRAELLLAQDFFDEAAILANRSYEQGPKLGALCRRNWTTIRLAREMRNNDAEAATAGEQAARCTVEPPVRM